MVGKQSSIDMFQDAFKDLKGSFEIKEQAVPIAE